MPEYQAGLGLRGGRSCCGGSPAELVEVGQRSTVKRTGAAAGPFFTVMVMR